MHLAAQIAQRVACGSGLHHEDLRRGGLGHADVVDAAGLDLDQRRGLVAQTVGGLATDLQLGNARADQRLRKPAGQQGGVKASIDQDVGGQRLGRREIGRIEGSQKHQQTRVLGAAQSGAVRGLGKGLPARRVRLRQSVHADRSQRCQHPPCSSASSAPARSGHGESGGIDHGAHFLAPKPTGSVMWPQFSPFEEQKLISIVKVYYSLKAVAGPTGAQPESSLCTSSAVVEAWYLRIRRAR